MARTMQPHPRPSKRPSPDEDSESNVTDDEEQMILEDLDDEDMRERWEVAQTHKNKYAGVSPSSIV